jgi:hypothetical protein
MKALFRELLKSDVSIVTSEDIYKMFPNINENAVQAKIKRCLSGGELIRLYKGIYAVNSSYSHKGIAEEQVAQAIDHSAYLSGIAALRFHNLIPEVVKFKTFFGVKKVKVDTKDIHFEIKIQRIFILKSKRSILSRLPLGSKKLRSQVQNFEWLIRQKLSWIHLFQ